jgi:ABC-type antimicrobial peptide transport system permease subunit
MARRVNEIGIRMALGATRNKVIRMVLGDALGMVCAGLAVGIPIALWGKTIVTSLIQHLAESGQVGAAVRFPPLETTFPIIVGALAMIVVAMLAAYLPARRAARIEPMEALRVE